MPDFSGQTAIVTGGTRGIGKSISEAFLTAGAQVVATYTSNDEAAQAFRDGLKQFEGKLHLRKFDVADYSACEQFFQYVDDELGGCQIVVNNSGIRKDAVVGAMEPADWNRVLEVNLTGTFNMSKFAVRSMMRKRYGRIINITSPCGHFGFRGQANYAASKAGQVGLARSLSKEVASRNITVNCVSPGFIDTELIADLPEDLVKQYKAQVPLGRFGTGTEVAACVLFLASRESSYVTGTTLEVTGGL
ncbi:MAG: 3-oxoacyl-ACP reductase FabG [Candidatus Wallbacteria bacterium]|nr:3-oxoacyl-ACP reductase FabG [Candidatus Wallbacteria bacterium]